MIQALRRLFRRTPPHLRGRVPVDCDAAPPVAEWIAEPDAVGRAFLESCPPLKPKPEMVRLLEQSVSVAGDLCGTLRKLSILQRHREHFEREAHAAMKRHKADKAEVEFPVYMPGHYEIRVFRGGQQVATTLCERIPEDAC